MGIVPTPESDRARFWAKVFKEETERVAGLGPCWIWTAAFLHNGYGAFRLAGKQRRAHVVSYEWHIGPTDGLSVLHHCDIRPCVRPDHLFRGTQKANIEDAISKGRMASGERNGMHTQPASRATGARNGQRLHPERTARGERVTLAKLTVEKVRKIRQLHAEGVTGLAIAAMFDMGSSAVYAVIRRQTWKHVV